MKLKLSVSQDGGTTFLCKEVRILDGFLFVTASGFPLALGSVSGDCFVVTAVPYAVDGGDAVLIGQAVADAQGNPATSDQVVSLGFTACSSCDRFVP